MFLVCGSKSFAVMDPGFYKHQKINKQLDLKREQGAKFHVKKRSKRLQQKNKEVKSFKKVRNKMILESEKRQRLVKKDSIKKEKLQAKKRRQALRFAKKRRKKSDINWQDELIEYDIKIPKLEKKRR